MNLERKVGESRLKKHEKNLADLFQYYPPEKPLTFRYPRHQIPNPKARDTIRRIWGSIPMSHLQPALRSAKDFNYSGQLPPVRFFEIRDLVAGRVRIEIDGVLGSKQRRYSGDSIVMEAMRKQDVAVYVVNVSDGLSVPWQDDIDIFCRLVQDRQFVNLLIEMEILPCFGFGNNFADQFSLSFLQRPDALNHWLNALYPRTPNYYNKAFSELYQTVEFLTEKREHNDEKDVKYLLKLMLDNYSIEYIRGRAQLAHELRENLKKIGVELPPYSVDGVNALLIFAVYPGSNGEFRVVGGMNRSQADVVAVAMGHDSFGLNSNVVLATANRNKPIDYLLASAGQEFGEEWMSNVNRQSVYPRKIGGTFGAEGNLLNNRDPSILSPEEIMFLRQDKQFDYPITNDSPPVVLGAFSDGGMYLTRDPLQHNFTAEEMVEIINRELAELDASPQSWAAGKFCQVIGDSFKLITGPADDFSGVRVEVSLEKT